MNAAAIFQQIVEQQKRGIRAGITAVCSSHPWVLEAAMEQARDDYSVVLIESTVNQVNQDGGYTGMTPEHFRRFVESIADRVGLPRERVLLGADHTGPLPWKDMPSPAAMQKACSFVADLVAAGYAKIHLDATTPLPGDPIVLDPGLIAEREASMAAAAEKAFQRIEHHGIDPPVYVIGSDVPPPGGEKETTGESRVTSAEEFIETVDACRDAFRRLGLDAAWNRTIAVVVQLGAEFGDQAVHDYCHARAEPVCQAARKHPRLVIEAHSTDYQTPAALRQMVEDGAAILKVGPALTCAMREALFDLESIERHLIDRLPEAPSDLQQVLNRVMIERPRHWNAYYHGDSSSLNLARKFSLLDRSRYYWGEPEVAAAVRRLVGNLSKVALPPTLLKQFCPGAYARIRRGELHPTPVAIIRSRIRDELDIYRDATR